ncbi:response regulator transcription factor [Bariatricus sp. SGI.154]|uniref:response regulator transcription factor n=1 Tax=Bariatricus sp. SGI.154 TaxID=3420549 RepID=UPI003CFEBDFC
MFHILLAEDDRELRRLYRSVLVKHGYNVAEADNGRQALLVLEEEHIDMLICDAMMPEIDGYELAKSVREFNKMIPIMMVTVLGDYQYKEKGFGIGIDDYLVKPIDVNEMILRVKALLRRSQNISEKKIITGSTVLEYEQLKVMVGDVEHILPQKEFYLFYKLMSYPNHIFTRFQLMDEIWGINSESNPHTLEVHIAKLRERFKENQDFKIITIRGLGYKVETREE